MKSSKAAVIIALVAVVAIALADPTWVEFTEGMRGQAPQLVVLESSIAGTTINLRTSGMWVEDVEEDGVTYQRITLPASHTSEVGKPMLPVVNRLVAIPATAGVKVIVESKNEIVLKDYLVYPTQIPETDSGPKPPFAIEEEFYKLDTLYPVELSEVGAPAIMNDVRLVHLTIQPFRYNPKMKELTVATDLTISLDYSGFDEHNALKSQRSYFSPQWERIYRSLILNFEDIYGSAGTRDTMGPPVVYLPVYYLIIYAHDFRPEVCPKLDSFIEWKRRKGFHVDVTDLNDIPGIIPQTPDPSNVYAVRDYILDWHGGGEFSFKDYVLLVGDAPIYNTAVPEGQQARYDPVQCADNSHVPTYAGWIYYDGYGQPSGRIYSDYFYQLMSEDNYPDFCIGRWCPENHTDLETYVNKVFAYERNPDAQWSCSKALLVSHRYYHYTDPLAYYRCKDSIDRFTTPWPSGYVHLPLHGIDAGSTNEDIINAINSSGGLGIINYRGHGYWGSWPEWNTAYENFDTIMVRNDLTNINSYPIVYNVCCANGCIPATLQGTYSPTEVMVEAWTRAPSRGAVAALGASRGSWTYENNAFDTTIFDSHFGQRLNCGMVINKGKIVMIAEGPNTAYGLENAKMYYWIGDPELDVWRGQPEQAYIEMAYSSNLLVYVYRSSDNAPVPGAKVCVYNSGVYQKVNYTDATGRASFLWDPYLTGTYYVTATNQTGPICIVPACTSFVWHYLMSGKEEESSVEIIDWQLKPVYPNPLHSRATISYSVAGRLGSTGTQSVKLSIFDVSGREVKVLASGEQSPGHYEVIWNGNDAKGAKCPSGVYFIRMYSNEFNANERIVLLR